MASSIGSITRAATREPGEPLRILTCPTHERYESGLAKTNAVFYAIRAEGIKDWNTKYAPLPPNYILLNPSRMENQIPMDVEFDLVLSQQKFGQFQILHQLARENHLPLVSLEHTLPVPSWTQTDLNGLRQMRGDVNVFISEFSRKEWGWGENDAEVVHHGVDTQLFSPAEQLVEKKPTVLSVVNDWINRDWCCGFKLWQSVVQNDIPVTVVGDTPGLSKPAASTHELVLRNREAQVFLNTSLISPVPTALLEAMSCGVAVVSTATAMIPEVIQHGVNGFISNDPAELRKYTQLLLNDSGLRKQIGDAARNTILEQFSMEKFVQNWNGVFERAAAIAFKG